MTREPTRELPDDMPVVVRPMKESDVDFVMSSWLKSFRKSRFAIHMTNDVYFRGHQRVVERLLRHARVVVACNPDDPDQIYGYVCGESSAAAAVIHYIYVKQPYRHFGIGRLLFRLFGQAPFVYTHQTELVEELGLKAVYNPYLAFEEKTA